MRNVRSLGLVSLFLSLCSSPLAALAAPAPILKEVRLSGQQSKTQVEIVADSPLTYTYYRMPDLLKVAIDLALVDPGDIGRTISGSGIITKITVEKKDITTFSLTRLLIDLQIDADFIVNADAADRSRLLITFTPKKNGAAREIKGSEQDKDAAIPATPIEPAVSIADPATPIVAAEPVTAAPAAPALETAPIPATEGVDATPVSEPVLEPVVPEAAASRTINDIRLSNRAVEIRATSRLDDYKAFTLVQPARLVIDVPRSKTPLAAKEISLKRFGISKARIGNYPDKVRIVLDAGGSTFPAYRIERNDKGLVIVFAPKPGK